MLQGWVIVVVSFAYVGVLFAIAWYGDQRADRGRSIISNPWVYALSMAVYCTSWTFYGSVGRLVSGGVSFLTIYLGPTLMAALWFLFLHKILRISKLNRITTIADFIASRYGKDALLGGLVTVIAVVGLVPYIALQLKAVSASFDLLSHHPNLVLPAPGSETSLIGDKALYVAVLMAVFAGLFGTRHLDATERHEGMVAAIAFESLVKLLAFLAVGLFVTFGMFDGPADIFQRAEAVPKLMELFAPFGLERNTYGSWAWLLFLSMMAVMFLPRQFQVAVVENVDESHLNRAVWLFPLYLLVINIFVLPIAFAGFMRFPQGAVDPDYYVLALPMSEHQGALALLVFIGGVSAATGMVIVESIALSTMVCNDLVVPLLLQFPSLRLAEQRNLSRWLIPIRRATIGLVLLLGYLYFRSTGEGYPLVSIGLVSFAAVAQFAPALLGGIYWKGGTRLGARVGLSAGFAVWFYTLMMPSLARSGVLPRSLLNQGPFGLAFLKPGELFGLTGWDPQSHAMFWSLLANVGCYLGISLVTKQTVSEHTQASLFVDVYRINTAVPAGLRFWRGTASVTALHSLVGRFLGAARANEVFAAYAREQQLDDWRLMKADARLVYEMEILLAGVIGASSARIVVSTVASEEPLSITEVMDILDEASQFIAYSRELERKSHELEVTSAELKAANERLKELDHLKDDFIFTVTHELRTPLTSIRSFAEILHDNPDLESEKRLKFLGIITKESERLSRLINQVLDMAKIESGNAEWHPVRVNLKEVIEESLAATSQLFNERGIGVDLRFPEVAPAITADRDRLMQVMLNLLSNAVKFCDPISGQVTIAVCEEHRHLRVDVRDNGSGISLDAQQTIFDKFRQVRDTRNGKPQGTGLGLPISRQIITHFGGRLWVESRPGAGATFSFTLPIAAQTFELDSP
ncbi:MAG TPA: sensor histidine kinase [Blastocatellia bacterium]|nr:sensor histidine kinase [Blastocatellia bacterium]